MSTSADGLGPRREVVGGGALIVAAISLLGASLLEFAAGDARGDGDNPADSLRYLARFGDLYSYSGLALVVAGIGLVVGVVAVHALARERRRSLAFDATSIFGLLAAGCFAVSGVMRMQANGTVPYIQTLDQQWGESAYLVIQIAGTQGILSTGVFALGSWLVAASIVLARRGVWWPALVAVFPVVVLLVLVGDLVVPSLDDGTRGEGLFLVYVTAALFGMPASCAALGLALVLPRTRARVHAGAAGG